MRRPSTAYWHQEPLLPGLAIHLVGEPHGLHQEEGERGAEGRLDRPQPELRLPSQPLRGTGLHVLLLPVLPLRGHRPGGLHRRQARQQDLELLRLPLHPPHARGEVRALRDRAPGDHRGRRPPLPGGPRLRQGEVLPPRPGPHGRGRHIRRGGASWWPRSRART